MGRTQPLTPLGQSVVPLLDQLLYLKWLAVDPSPEEPQDSARRIFVVRQSQPTKVLGNAVETRPTPGVTHGGVLAHVPLIDSANLLHNLRG